jgi:hypothetical protein
MSVYSNRQVKIFKRVLVVYYTEYNSIAKNKVKIPAVSQECISKFSEQVFNHVEPFASCDSDVLNKIDLLKNIDPNEVKIQWESLHTLFLLSYKDQVNFTKEQVKAKLDSSRLTLRAPKNDVTPFGMDPSLIAQMLPLVTNVMNGDNNNALSSLVKETSDTFMKSLEGKQHLLKEINPMDLFQNIMSGNNTINNIDFTDAIESIKTSIDSKLKNNELSKDNLNNQIKNIIPEQLIKDLEKIAIQNRSSESLPNNEPSSSESLGGNS